MQAQECIQIGLEVLQLEANALLHLQQQLDITFYQACELLCHCEGRVIVIGMGKSGHIGGKIAATLASTGTPAFFVHPGEASHGDLGMITDKDVVLALSNSGETEEILTLLPIIQRLPVPLISITNNTASRLAQASNVNLYIDVEKEACPLNLAPTTSTTVSLALGDALATALLKWRGFTADDFARSHPGGRLGRRLLLSINEVMHSGKQLPLVNADALLSTALIEMSAKGLGMVNIIDEQGHLLGIFTDGDLRRTLDHGYVDIQQTPIQNVMTSPCLSISPDALAIKAIELMEQHKINALPVIDKEKKLVGSLNMHDLLRAGIV